LVQRIDEKLFCRQTHAATPCRRSLLPSVRRSHDEVGANGISRHMEFVQVSVGDGAQTHQIHQGVPHFFVVNGGNVDEPKLGRDAAVAKREVGLGHQQVGPGEGGGIAADVGNRRRGMNHHHIDRAVAHVLRPNPPRIAQTGHRISRGHAVSCRDAIIAHRHRRVVDLLHEVAAGRGTVDAEETKRGVDVTGKFVARLRQHDAAVRVTLEPARPRQRRVRALHACPHCHDREVGEQIEAKPGAGRKGREWRDLDAPLSHDGRVGHRRSALAARTSNPGPLAPAAVDGDTHDRHEESRPAGRCLESRR
jgi:hypothetical protein